MTKLPRYVETWLDRQQVRRYYFRRGKGARVKLPDDPESLDFKRAYEAALAGSDPQRVKVDKCAPGTLDELLARFYQTTYWRELKPITQKNYRRILEKLRNRVGKASGVRLGLLPVTGLTKEAIEKLMGELTPAAAYSLRRILRPVMAFAVATKVRADNPMLAIPAPKGVKNTPGYRAMTAEDITAFRNHWALGTKQRLALELLLYTGARRSDAVTLGPKNRKDGGIEWIQSKTGGEVWVPEEAELTAAVEAMKVLGVETFLVTEYGKAFTAQGFTNWFKKACKDAGLPSNSSPHGMRKALLTQLAEGGASTHQIMAVSGHKTLAEVERYTKSAEKKRLAKAAMEARRQPDAQTVSPNSSPVWGKGK